MATRQFADRSWVFNHVTHEQGFDVKCIHCNEVIQRSSAVTTQIIRHLNDEGYFAPRRNMASEEDFVFDQGVRLSFSKFFIFVLQVKKKPKNSWPILQWQNG